MTKISDPSISKARFSKSSIWDSQKEFFDVQGTNAWDRNVPFYITSNVFIAYSYANMLIQFMQEWSKKAASDKQPFYILELGAGTGMFGFHLIREVLELKTQLHLSHSFVYVMSDFTENNIQFWREHPDLQKFVKDGILGFSKFDMTTDDKVTIELKGIANSKIIDLENCASNPLIVIANYVFDSVPCDLFYIHSGKLQEGRITEKTDPAYTKPKNSKEAITEDVFKITYHDVTLPFYKEKKYDTILEKCRKEQDGVLFFPTTSLDCLKNLMKISHGKLFVISSDKAYGRFHKSFSSQKLQIASHGSFSVNVDYHIIDEYSKLCSGSCYYQNTQRSLNTSVFTFGFKLDKFVKTLSTITHFIDVEGPAHLFNVHEHFNRTKDDCSTTELFSYMTIFHWDPHILNKCIELLLSKADSLNNTETVELAEGMIKSSKMFYYVPWEVSFFDNIAALFYKIKDYHNALQYYRLSMKYSKKPGFTHYNMGLCCFLLHNYDAALDSFTMALSYDHVDKNTLKKRISETKKMIVKNHSKR